SAFFPDSRPPCARPSRIKPINPAAASPSGYTLRPEGASEIPSARHEDFTFCKAFAWPALIGCLHVRCLVRELESCMKSLAGIPVAAETSMKNPDERGTL